MTHRQTSRTTREKVEIFRACFTGLPNVYGTYDPRTDQVHQVKQPVTYEVMLHHLQGRRSYGVYLLVGDQTRAVAADFDEEDTFPPLEFVRQAGQYGIKAYIERSKRKGWHAWIFTELPGVPAVKARLVAKTILDDIGTPSTEIFPKQDRLNSGASYGNFINAPLFGRLVPKGRTIFVSPEDGFRPYPDQWEFLESVQRVPESLLDEIIEINSLASSGNDSADSKPAPAPRDACFTFGLPPCAQAMLTEGVVEYQRVACFRLALHLKKAGLPHDIAIVALQAWAAKNCPKNSKRIITDAEILEQTKCAYTKNYHGCGCEEAAIVSYCSPDCPLKCNTKVKSSREGRNASSTASESRSASHQ